MKKLSLIVKFSIFITVFVLMVLVTVGLFTTGSGKSGMMTNEELMWQKNRLIVLSVFAGFLLIGIISFGAVLIIKNKKSYDMILESEESDEVDDE